ncbi:RNA polymerase sigma factor [Sphingobacterium spiritivorum]|uniref:RNA polymerase sigma factor n=2 Tax=Sphingobacterium spiritivorum TaxID=258 RepID=UPI003DA63F56
MKLLRKYTDQKEPMSLRKALDDCGMGRGERGKAYVYKKYYGYLMAIVIRYIKHEMESEEVVNECFVKAFSKLDSFNLDVEEERLEKSFRSWIARIAVNQSIDFLRSKKQMLMLDDVSEYELIPHAVHNHSSLEVQDILKLLDELPDIQRTIFNMYEVEGFSHDEIASLLNIPDSTSRTYLTRAKQKLRKLYVEQFNTADHRS